MSEDYNLTAETLAELRLLLDEAPQLPYLYSPGTHGNPSDGPTYVALEAELEGRWEEVATGNYDQWSGGGLALAAAAVNALPSLLAATDELARMREARDNARAEVDRLSAAVRRVRELHRESNGSLSALYPNPICECGKDYPCQTARALAEDPK